MFHLTITSFDLTVSHDLWIVLITGICAVVVVIGKQRR